jgi:hypothetical protein
MITQDGNLGKVDQFTYSPAGDWRPRNRHKHIGLNLKPKRTADIFRANKVHKGLSGICTEENDVIPLRRTTSIPGDPAGMSALSPFNPHQRTCVGRQGTSVSCQPRQVRRSKKGSLSDRATEQRKRQNCHGLIVTAAYGVSKSSDHPDRCVC